MQVGLETYEMQRIPLASHFLFSSAGSERRFISQIRGSYLRLRSAHCLLTND
jgi:hypothetical protein